MLYKNSGVSEELINEASVEVTKHLPGRCKFCPRSFESGERIVFGMLKNVQMAYVEADIEKAEPGGLGESHNIQLINAHVPCAIKHKDQFRSVNTPRKLRG